MNPRRVSRRIAVTGGPGAGKTSLLRGLTVRGFHVVPEVARAIISDRKSRGLEPRPAPVDFALEIIDRDIAQYDAIPPGQSLVFFDRTLLDSMGMLAELDRLPEAMKQTLLERYPYHRTAFILPPWQAIYCTDAERDQTFEHAVGVYQVMREWYLHCGYRLVEVPPGSIDERCDFVLQKLAEPEERSFKIAP